MKHHQGIFLGLFLLVLTRSTSVYTQPCSIVSIDAPENTETSIVTLVAKLTIDPAMVKEFRWTVSAGTIVSGQNTSSIVWDAVGLAGQAITATVEIVGPQTTCATQASQTITLPPRVIWDSFDDYGDIRFADEKARLDNFAIQLLNLPASSGQLIGYAGQRTFPREMALRLKRAKDYLVNVRHLQSDRIISLDCGHRIDLSITLWLVPKGATHPSCDTTSLIPTDQLDLTKPRPKMRSPRARQRR
jgi:hypothetical protein